MPSPTVPAATPPATSRILLLRHAETSAPDRFHGAESDVGLGDRGHRQAAEVAARLARLKPVALYASGMRRARETARPIGTACGLETRLVAALHERRMGALSGMEREQGRPFYEATRERWMAGDLEATHEGGESFEAIRQRVVPAFRELARPHRGETIVVVAHGVVIRVLLTTLLEGSGPHEFQRFGIDFVGVNDLRSEGRTWFAVALNETGELAVR